MNMTHYMALLAANQPWNLLFFMVIPVILAETVAITELHILYTRQQQGWIRQVNRWCGVAVGIYFAGVIGYLLPTAVIPITQNHEWRTALDVVAVGAYLASGLPLIGIALLETGLLHRQANEARKLALHAIYVALFLVLAHVAMFAGMADPALLGYAPAQTPAGSHSLH
ncbi:MAG: hypothetical protein LBP52_02315 [Burkholderiaceae bacterium]|nr:hypothetical protein [Burkholderiaceae bacterium]